MQPRQPRRETEGEVQKLLGKRVVTNTVKAVKSTPSKIHVYNSVFIDRALIL